MEDPLQPPSDDSKTYPIRTVAKLTGLTPDLIRAWERRYQVVAPVRGPRGARLYGSEDVRRLRDLARAVDSGRSIGDVAQLDIGELRRLVEAPVSPQTPRAGNGAGVADLVAALDRHDIAALERGLGDALLALGATRFARELAMPLLTVIGERWSEGTLSISQEHLVANALRSLLGPLTRSPRAAGTPSILLAGMSGERHEFGLLLVAVLAAERGLATFLLGSDVPADEICAAASRLGAAAVGISMIVAENRDNAAQALRHIENSLPASIEIWAGGGDAHHVRALASAERTLVIQTAEHLEAQLDRLAARLPAS